MAAIALPPLPPYAERRRADRGLAIAIGVSIAVHAVVLSLKFTYPDAFKFRNAPPLEVVLVNSKSEEAPQKADVLAQRNLDGGGTTDQDKRAKTPLPVLPRAQSGADETQRAQARVQQLEQQQQQLLAQLKTPTPNPVPKPQQTAPPPKPEAPVPAPDIDGRELANRTLAMARLEAQIARQVEEYNKRPRKNSANIRAREVPYAMYAEDWRQKVERVGNANYPSEASARRIYGNLRLTVGIKTDGTIAYVDIDRPSGYAVLDRAAERIVRLAGPYAPLSADIRKDTDILEITRTWIFGPGDRLSSE